MRTAVIIPARYASTRLPGKPLLRRTGKYLIQHVLERLSGIPGLHRLLVATDEVRIAEAVRSFGGEAVMTSASHPSGTDRVAEAAKGIDGDCILNIQGDEPEISPATVQSLIAVMAQPGVLMGTLACPATMSELTDPSKVKVVFDRQGDAMYFSRSPIPHGARPGDGAWRHVGVYGFRREFLFRFASLDPTDLERRERLEQLRALEHGYKIRVGRIEAHPPGIDTPQDYDAFVDRMGKAKA